MLGTLNEEQIDRVLRSEVIGRIGCHAEGRTYVVPITYAYDGTSVYGHSVEGLKLRLMRANPQVCFEVDHMETMANWQSVIAWGTFEELHGEAAYKAMQALVNRLLPLLVSETSQPAHGREPSRAHGAATGGQPAVVYRLLLGEKTGRFEKR